ncbi:desmoglein-2-like, partial [Arapaima gigas]
MALPPVGTVLIFLVTLTACKADAGEQQQARAARRRREWIVPPIKLLENADLTERESIAKIWSDKNINAKLRYFLGGAGADKDPVNLFIVNEATGFVRITGILDREQIPVYNLEGMAKFLNGTTAEKNINLHIEVEDENDNPPKFTRTSGSVKESSKPGTFILQVNATDADEPGTPHTQIAYRIVKQEPPDTSLMFHLEEETGRLYVKEPSLDREKHGVYTLVVEGVDMAGAPNGNTGTGTVQVSVLDINDNIPTLEKDEYEATVDEDTANVEVLRMKAFDVDLENSENWLAHFEIVSGNEDGVFSIETDPKTNEGVLILNKPVDYEMVKEVDLGVAVRNVAPLHVGDAGGAESGAGGAGGAGGADGGGAGGGSWVGGGVGSSTSGFMNFGNTGPGGKTYAVKVNVKNLPDGPGFSPKVKPIPVSEDPKALTVRSVIATYPAVDGDTGKPAENVRYAKSYDPDNWISVDEKTAEIKLNKHPDRESKFLTNGTYYAKIICMTEELPSKTSTGTIALQVQDANDHCPQLTARNQSLCTGDRLVTVTAVDEDFDPNAAPFQFTVVPEGTSKEWEVESYNDTSVVLKKHSGVWPGLYKLTLEIKDQQGVACPDKQVLQLDVCTCTEEGSCTLRGAQASSAKMGFLGIGAVLPGLLLLLLVPLLLLFCTCGGPGDMIVEDFTDMPFDVKEYLIPYHTEGMGEDKEVPLLSAPPLAAQEQVFIDHLDTKTSTVKLGSPADIYPSGRRDSAQKGPTGADFLVGQDSTVRKYRSGRFFCSETPAIGGDIYSEISLPDAYLKEYYSQASKSLRDLTCAAEAQACLDSVTAYCYEGVGSPVGSVGCCSLNDADDNLDFLADLDPKFMTLAEICRGTEGGAEDSPGALKPSDEQSSVMNHPITTTSVDHSTPRLALVSSEEKVVETSCSPTCVQRQAVLPCQQYLIQQPVYYGTPPVLQTTPYILEPQVHNTVLVSELPAVPNLQAMFVIDGVADYESIEMEKNVFLGPANHGGVFLVQPGNLSRGDNVVLAERNNISGLVVEQGNVGQNQGPAIVDNLPRSQNIMVAEEKPDAGQVLQGRPLWIHQREDIPVQQPVLLVERPIVQEGTPRLSPEASPGGPFSDNVLLVDKPNSTVGTPAGMKPVLDTKSKENKLQDRNVTDAEQEGQSSAWQVNQGEPSLVSQDVMQMEHLSEPQHSFQVEKDESTEQTGQDKFGVTTPVRDAESRASDTNVIGKTEQKLCDLEMSYCTIEGSGSVEANENTPELVPQNIKNVKMDTNYHQTAVEHSSELLQDPCEDELPTVCNKNLVSSESEPSLHQISDEEAAGPEMLEANSVEKCFITYENWEEDVQGVKTNPDGSNCLSVEENWPIAQEILEENGSVSEETLGEEQLSSSHSEELLKSREDASQAIECDADMDSSNSETDELE